MDTPILRPYLKSISDAIRTKLGTTEKINASDFAEKILSIPTGGGDDLWDYYQENGSRKNYKRAFTGCVWDENTLKPKYSIKPTNANQMFYYAKNLRSLKNVVTNVKRNNPDFEFDTSLCTDLTGFIQAADNVTELPEISTVSCNAVDQFLFWNALLKSVDKLILKSDGSQNFTNSFSGLSALTDIVIEGKFGCNVNISSSSKLTKNSIISIINALHENASNKTITFSKDAINREFGIDVDNTSTYPEGSEFHTLRYSKSNWNFAYA